MAAGLLGGFLAECRSDLVRYRATAMPLARGFVMERLPAVMNKVPAASMELLWPLNPQSGRFALVPSPRPKAAYPWGVRWPGHADHRECVVDTAAICEAFLAWRKFSLHIPSLLGELERAAARPSRAPEIPDELLTAEGLLHKRMFAAMRG
uniref:Uncharacterized protein n=1 Tax=Alexandrium monilatum TaxID=311494 RepID=A0A7S4QEK0_9DINO